jgi:hypothetical protein
MQYLGQALIGSGLFIVGYGTGVISSNTERGKFVYTLVSNYLKEEYNRVTDQEEEEMERFEE